MLKLRAAALATVFVTFVATPARGDEPFRYPEAKHGRGELRYVNGVPVLLVQGSPAEIGEQIGVLALKPALGLTKLVDQFIKANHWELVYPMFLKTGSIMLPQFPPEHLAELKAAAKASGWSKDLLIFANTVPDLRKLTGCSVLIVEAAHSATGGPLFGRNMDARPIGPFSEYTLVTVYRPAGKRAFAAIVYPGLFGCASGINDAGLALAELTVTTAADDSPALNVAGVPFMLALRRVLEECRTVEEAETLLRSLKRTVRQNVAVCDQKHAAVFEITPKSLVVRPAESGVCACTNHFRTQGLATQTNCPRYSSLVKAQRADKLSVDDVAHYMDTVNQGDWTLQTMIFEPAALTLHLAFGKGPATRLPLHTLELKGLFAGEREQKRR